MYKILKKAPPDTFQHHHTYLTRNRENLRVPAHSHTLFQHSLSYLAPKIWNAIPNDIKLLPTIHSFKKQLKNNILRNY